jgi:hypothetical protein
LATTLDGKFVVFCIGPIVLFSGPHITKRWAIVISNLLEDSLRIWDSVWCADADVRSLRRFYLELISTPDLPKLWDQWKNEAAAEQNLLMIKPTLNIWVAEDGRHAVRLLARNRHPFRDFMSNIDVNVTLWVV